MQTEAKIAGIRSHPRKMMCGYCRNYGLVTDWAGDLSAAHGERNHDSDLQSITSKNRCDSMDFGHVKGHHLIESPTRSQNPKGDLFIKMSFRGKKQTLLQFYVSHHGLMQFNRISTSTCRSRGFLFRGINSGSKSGGKYLFKTCREKEK